MKNSIVLVIVFAAFFFLYRSCTKGYDNYVYFVQASDEAVFANHLSKGDPRILNHGRKLKTDVTAMDKDMDQNNGSALGKIRWYICSGIDCDEGWQQGFLPEK